MEQETGLTFNAELMNPKWSDSELLGITRKRGSI